MKKIGLLALPLILAACSGTPTGSTFSAYAGGDSESISYAAYYTVDSATQARVYTGGYSYTLASQPTIQFINHAGSVGASFSTATVTIYDQSGNVIDLGKTVDGSQVLNPYKVSFIARLIPGWACTDANGAATPQVDPNSCAPGSRVGYERLVSYPDEGNVINSPIPIGANKKAGVLTQNIAERLSTLAHTTGTTFNGYMVIEFSGTDDRRIDVKLKSAPIPLNVYRGPDLAQ